MISAIVLAAGLSKRMGRSKLVLPWGETTVIGAVIETLLEGGINSIYLVGGGNMQELRAALPGYQIRYVYNPRYANGEIITSVINGIKAIHDNSEALLIVLGDQPHIDANIIQKLKESYAQGRGKIIVPSFHDHRGHPWLVDRSLWDGIVNLESNLNLKDFLDLYQEHIAYVIVDTPSVLQDLDTPEDYNLAQTG